MAQEYIRNLIKKTQEGDKEARQELLKGYANDIVYRSRLYLGDEAAAKAATTDIFMKMLNTLDEALDEDNFDDWYQKIVRDVAIRKVIPLTSDGVVRNLPYTKSDEVIDYSEEYSMEDSRRMILNVITDLPKAERVVSTLYFYDGLTIKDIAQKLYLTEGEVESLLTMAKTKINASGVSVGAFMQMLANIQQTSTKTETLPINTITMAKHVGTDTTINKEPEVVEDTLDIPAQEEIEEQVDEMAIEGSLEEDEENVEPLFFTKHNQLVQEETNAYEKMTQERAKEELESEGYMETHNKNEEVKQIREEVPVAPVRETVKEPAPKKTSGKKRRVDWAHLALVVALALLLLLGLYFLFFKDRGNREPNTSVVTPEPTQVTEPTESPEPTEGTAPNETNNNGGILGKVTIGDNMAINIRTSPNTSSEVVGTVYTSEIYDVYEVKEEGDYTWYRIGDNRWIADGGGWLTYEKN